MAKRIFFYAIGIIVAIVVIIGIILGNTSCKHTNTAAIHTVDTIYSPVEKEMYIIDSNAIAQVYEECSWIIDSIKRENDTLTVMVDSLNEELFIAKYKLERIREYNTIAAKGNNIKYLRGWINRTLDE